MVMVESQSLPASQGAGPAAGVGLLFLREEELRLAQDLLLLATRELARDADALLAQHGLGRAHHRALHFIARQPGLTVGDLLALLGITKQSLARVLRQLIDNGYIEQRTGDADRRQRLLHATDKGRQLFEVLSGTQTSRIDAALARLPPEARAHVLGFFVGMVDSADRDLLDRLRLTERL